jgi:hypothetical protein
VPLFAWGGGSVLTEHQSRDKEMDRSTRHLQWVIKLTCRTANNFIFYSKFAVHNILQHYFVSGEDDKKPGLVSDIQ